MSDPSRAIGGCPNPESHAQRCAPYPELLDTHGLGFLGTGQTGETQLDVSSRKGKNRDPLFLAHETKKLLFDCPSGFSLPAKDATPSSLRPGTRRVSMFCPSQRRPRQKWVWLKIQQGQTAGVGPCFHLPGFHCGTGFLSRS